METDPELVKQRKFAREEAELVMGCACDSPATSSSRFWEELHKLVKAKYESLFPPEKPPLPMTYSEACRFELDHYFPWGESVRETSTNYIAAFANTSEFKKKLLRYMASTRYKERQDKGE